MNPRKLKELAAISQLVASTQAPELDRQRLAQQAEASRMQNMLAIMGLGQQAQQNSAMDEIRKRQAEIEAERNTIEKTQGQDRTNASLMSNFLQAYPGMSQINPEAASALDLFMRSKDPAWKSATEQAHQNTVQTKAQEVQQKMVAPMYQAMGKDIPKLQKSLSTAQTAVSPETWNNIDWVGLNSSLPTPPSEIRDKPYMTGPSRSQMMSTSQSQAAPVSPQPQANSLTRTYGPDPAPNFNAWMDKTAIPAIQDFGHSVQYYSPPAYLARLILRGMNPDPEVRGSQTIRNVLQKIGY